MIWLGHVKNSLSPHNKHITFYKWTFSEISYMQVYSHDYFNGLKAKYMDFCLFHGHWCSFRCISKWNHYVITLILSLTRCNHSHVVITMFNTLNLHRRAGLRGKKWYFYLKNDAVLFTNNEGIWAIILITLRLFNNNIYLYSSSVTFTVT